MLVKINFKNLIAAIAALVIFILVLNGSLQSVIHFEGVLNEMLFAFGAFFLGLIQLYLSFEKPQNC